MTWTQASWIVVGVIGLLGVGIGLGVWWVNAALDEMLKGRK